MAPHDIASPMRLGRAPSPGRLRRAAPRARPSQPRSPRRRIRDRAVAVLRRLDRDRLYRSERTRWMILPTNLSRSMTSMAYTGRAMNTGKRERAMMGLLCVGGRAARWAPWGFWPGAHPLGSELPLMTLLINFLGSVAIGAIVEASSWPPAPSRARRCCFEGGPVWRIHDAFSTFSWKPSGSSRAAVRHRRRHALVSVVLCVAGVLVGKTLARALLPTG